MIREIVSALFGTLTPVELITSFIFASLGIFIKWYFQTKAAVKHNPETPHQFSLCYWWDNNKPKMIAFLATIAVLFVTIRFPKEIIGMEWSYAYALIVGLSFDRLAEIIKTKMKIPS